MIRVDVKKNIVITGVCAKGLKDLPSGCICVPDGRWKRVRAVAENDTDLHRIRVLHQRPGLQGSVRYSPGKKLRWKDNQSLQ